MSIRVEGVDRLTRKLDAMPQRTIDSVYDEMEDIGEDLKAVSQQRAPMLTGELRAQAYVTSSRGVNSASVEVGYDGPEGYLIPMHEGGWRNLRAWGNDYGPTRIEKWTTPGSGPKFIEGPFAETLAVNRRRIRNAVRRGLR